MGAKMNEEAAKHIGNGLCWLGFWIFLGMVLNDPIKTFKLELGKAIYEALK